VVETDAPAAAEANVDAVGGNGGEGKVAAKVVAVKVCGKCGLEITDGAVMARGVPYHNACFACEGCNVSLAGNPFLAKEGSNYCQNCYYEKFNPKCGHCKEIIKGQYISALGKSWHPEHFVCTTCSCALDGAYFKHDDMPYCQEHYQELFGAKCAKCDKVITGQIFEALGKQYHLECFTCVEGDHRIEEGMSFLEHEGKIYCAEHYAEAVLPKCDVCKKPIKSQYLKISGKTLHPECWKCAQCDCVLEGGNGAMINNVYYCVSCATKLASGQEQPRDKSAAPAIPPVNSDEGKTPADAEPEKVFSQAPKKVKRASVLVTANQIKQAPGMLPADGKTTYTLEQLQDGSSLVASVDLKKKEAYLSEGDFAASFGCSRDEFNKRPLWKRNQAKKKLKLF
jgi:hypothetical protein